MRLACPTGVAVPVCDGTPAAMPVAPASIALAPATACLALPLVSEPPLAAKMNAESRARPIMKRLHRDEHHECDHGSDDQAHAETAVTT